MVDLNPGKPVQQFPSSYGDPNDMISLSKDLTTRTEKYVDEIIGMTAGLRAPVINPIFPTVGAAPAVVTAPPPNIIDVTWTTPTQPSAFTGSVNIDDLLPGPFGGQAPSLVFPPRPNPFDALVPAAPTTNLNFTYPTVAVTLPPVPQLYTLDTVAFNIGQIPTFTASVPALTITAPSVIPYVEGGMYTSQLLTDLQESLEETINAGANLILPQNIERGIFERARDKEYRQVADGLAELDRMEAMGWAMPPGVWLDARIKLQTEMGYNVNTFNRDAAIGQAKLALEQLTSARNTAVELEKAFVQYANEQAQRQFEAAKYATEASISIYNAQVEQYKAALEGYRVQALVYETQIKGILAQVDIIKAQIEYEQVKAQINTSLIEQYKAQVQAAELTVEIYKTQVEIIQVQAQVEKLKVDIFSAQIQAYVGQVNAYTAQVEGYKAEIEAQGAIEQVYKTQVDAYVATVQAGVAEANARVSVFEAEVKTYTAQLDGYRASLQAMTEQARSASLYNQAQADVYRSLTAALGTYNEVVTKQWEAVINEQMQVAQIGIQAAKVNADLYIAIENLIAESAKVGAQVMAQLGAASLGAIHWANNSTWEAISSSSSSLNTNQNFNYEQ